MTGSPSEHLQQGRDGIERGGPEERTDALQRELHELDARLNEVRREIFLVQKGLRPAEDRQERLAELDREFHALGDRFREVYDQWRESQMEEET